MEQRQNILFFTTIVSGLLFGALIILATLSPLSEIGVDSNPFNSMEMWMSIFVIFLIYLVPLLLYKVGLRWVRYFMAILCGIGLILLSALLVFVVLVGVTENLLPSFVSMIIICSLAILTNIIWLFVGLNNKSEEI